MKVDLPAWNMKIIIQIKKSCIIFSCSEWRTERTQQLFTSKMKPFIFSCVAPPLAVVCLHSGWWKLEKWQWCWVIIIQDGHTEGGICRKFTHINLERNNWLTISICTLNTKSNCLCNIFKEPPQSYGSRGWKEYIDMKPLWLINCVHRLTHCKRRIIQRSTHLHMMHDSSWQHVWCKLRWSPLFSVAAAVNQSNPRWPPGQSTVCVSVSDVWILCFLCDILSRVNEQHLFSVGSPDETIFSGCYWITTEL